MVRVLIARYNNYSTFRIPKNLPLLSPDDNEKAEWATPYSWGVKYGTLYYFDEKKEQQKIEVYCEDTNVKYPADVEEEEEESDDEEEDESDEEEDE